MDKKTIIISVLVVIIVGYFGFVAYNNQLDKAYMQGAEDASIMIYQQIYDNLNTNGYIPFSYYDGEQTQTINLVPYVDPNVRN